MNLAEIIEDGIRRMGNIENFKGFMKTFAQVLRKVPIQKEKLEKGLPIVPLIVRCDLADSNRQAQEKLKAGAFCLNEKRINGKKIVTSDDIVDGRYILLRLKNKRNCVMIVMEQ